MDIWGKPGRFGENTEGKIPYSAIVFVGGETDVWEVNGEWENGRVFLELELYGEGREVRGKDQNEIRKPEKVCKPKSTNRRNERVWKGLIVER